MWWTIGILIVLVLIIVIGVAVNQASQKANEAAIFTAKFEGWDVYASPLDLGVVAIHHERKLIVVGTTASYIEMPWSDLCAVEILRNGETITHTNRGSQALGAAVGALLLGPAGLLVGGLSGSKRQHQNISNLALKITVDDSVRPIHRVTFFEFPGNGVRPDDAMVKLPAERTEHWHALLSNAIRSDLREQSVAALPSTQVASVEERLSTLWRLTQEGALSKEEFESQKRALLGPALPPS